MLVFTMGCGGSVIFVYTDGDQSVVFIPDVDDGQAQDYQMISECSHHNIVLTPIRFMRINTEIGVGKSWWG